MQRWKIIATLKVYYFPCYDSSSTYGSPKNSESSVWLSDVNTIDLLPPLVSVWETFLLGDISLCSRRGYLFHQ